MNARNKHVLVRTTRTRAAGPARDAPSSGTRAAGPARDAPSSGTRAAGPARVKNINEYNHNQASRISIPTEQTEGNVETSLDKYAATPSRGQEPTLNWNRLSDRSDVNPAPLYIREKISPKSVIDNLKTSRLQSKIFESFNGFEPGTKYRYYDHSTKGKWQNRMIRGDSARVMAALLSENLRNSVQTIFFDPPYGIKFDSNFHPSLNQELQSDVQLPKDPISVQAFCDTWERNIDSYLDAMLCRLYLMKDLLKDTGHIFVQIGSTNVHRMALLLDEVFGSANRITTITFAKTTGKGTGNFIPEGSDYILWYVKNKNKATQKYRDYYEILDKKQQLELMSAYAMVEDQITGECRKLTKDECNDIDNLPKHLRLFQRSQLHSQKFSTERSMPYVWNGKEYLCPSDSQWRVGKSAMDNLAKKNRLIAVEGGLLQWKKYVEEKPGKPINNQWVVAMKTFTKRYAVQTTERIIERCILMTSDPGDLVLDPTGGSGSTASVAENWGRRWIVIDTSPVSIAIMRQYMSTMTFDWYVLQDSLVGSQKELELGGVGLPPPYSDDPSKGFVYNRVPHVSAKILGNDENVPPILLVNNPIKEKNIKRVSGPFTVESETSSYIISPLATSSNTTQQSEFVKHVITYMSNEGIDYIENFNNQDPTSRKSPIIIKNITTSQLNSFTHIGIRGDTHEKVAIFITPDISPVDNRLIRNAATEAKSHKFKTLIVSAFEFQPLIPNEFVSGIDVIKVSMNRALQQREIDTSKIKRALVMVGDPRIKIEKLGDKWKVYVMGYDIFDPITGNIICGDESNVNCWMLDIDYDGESFFAKEIHFPNTKSKWSASLLKKIQHMLGKDLDLERWNSFKSLHSAPFTSLTGKIAVKIITTSGDEMVIRGSLESMLNKS